MFTDEDMDKVVEEFDVKLKKLLSLGEKKMYDLRENKVVSFNLFSMKENNFKFGDGVTLSDMSKSYFNHIMEDILEHNFILKRKKSQNPTHGAFIMGGKKSYFPLKDTNNTSDEKNTEERLETLEKEIEIPTKEVKLCKSRIELLEMTIKHLSDKSTFLI